MAYAHDISKAKRPRELTRDIPGIEGLVNLASLVGEDEIVFVGFPLKFEDGDGGPMRAAALVY